MTPKYIILHCSDSPQGRDDNASTIHRWHLERGWSGIGYHYVILEDGAVDRGRPEYWQGAHTKGYNSKSLGVCMIGLDSFTDAQIESARSLISNIMQEYDIKKENVLGHYETAEANGKTCPNYPIEDFRDAL